LQSLRMYWQLGSGCCWFRASERRSERGDQDESGRTSFDVPIFLLLN
jgi:hypothetical protein